MRPRATRQDGQRLNKLPKGLQKKAKGRLQDIWMAETRKDAESAFDFFLEAYGPKYDKAAACLAKDRDVLLTFYDFPADLEACTHDQPHREHVRHGSSAHLPDQGLLSRKTAMVFKLCSALRENGENSMDQPSRRDHSRRQIRDGERQDRAPHQPIHNF